MVGWRCLKIHKPFEGRRNMPIFNSKFNYPRVAWSSDAQGGCLWPLSPLGDFFCFGGD